MSNSNAWATIFVIDGTELKWETLPAFTVGGEVMLMAKDKFDNSTVPKVYDVTRVIFDVYGTKQYIYLEDHDVEDG